METQEFTVYEVRGDIPDDETPSESHNASPIGSVEALNHDEALYAALREYGSPIAVE